MHAGKALTRGLWGTVSLTGAISLMLWLYFAVVITTPQTMANAMLSTVIMLVAMMPAAIAHRVWGN